VQQDLSEKIVQQQNAAQHTANSIQHQRHQFQALPLHQIPGNLPNAYGRISRVALPSVTHFNNFPKLYSFYQSLTSTGNSLQSLGDFLSKRTMFNLGFGAPVHFVPNKVRADVGFNSSFIPANNVSYFDFNPMSFTGQNTMHRLPPSLPDVKNISLTSQLTMADTFNLTALNKPSVSQRVQDLSHSNKDSSSELSTNILSGMSVSNGYFM